MKGWSGMNPEEKWRRLFLRLTLMSSSFGPRIFRSVQCIGKTRGHISGYCLLQFTGYIQLRGSIIFSFWNLGWWPEKYITRTTYNRLISFLVYPSDGQLFHFLYQVSVYCKHSQKEKGFRSILVGNLIWLFTT